MRSSTPPLALNVVAPGALRPEQDVRQSRIVDHTVPANFTELFDRYYGYVVRLIKRRGIHHSDVEDVAQAILLHFYRRESLKHFDPNYTVATNGGQRTVQFTTFLSGFVFTYLQHHLTMQDRNAAREAPDPISADGDPLSEDSWVNVRGPRYDADFSNPEYLEMVKTIHTRLHDARDRFSGKCDLVALFEAMREQIALTGKYDSAALAEQFDAPVSTVQKWIGRLRLELKGL